MVYVFCGYTLCLGLTFFATINRSEKPFEEVMLIYLKETISDLTLEEMAIETPLR